MQDDSQQKTQVEPVLTEGGTVLQTNLFGPPAVITQPPDPLETPFPPLVRTNPLTDQSSLAACALPYRQELMLRGKSNYTVTCFLSDLKLFRDYMGDDTPVGRITREDLTDWLMQLKFGNKGQPPAPKTMARRVTFLKNFFSWLATEGVIREDPSASLILERPLPPLPELLFDNEIQLLLSAAAEDARAHCLIYLILHSGLKKEEVMGLRVQHVDLSDEETPIVTVHFAPSTGKQHRERRLALPGEFTMIFRRYLEAYHPTDTVFACTDRNLNYILTRVVKAAGIKKRVTLQLLRDTFAVQQLRSGVSLDALREKLGLSDEAWLESKEKYRRLAFPK
ncbi:MAG: tyrosine-type recombinase/integrase [Ktedonobacteraceae bacterium]|nr:tyrosine-type recombinase/integrase [Ktedonobacteraceae bacterium]